MRRLPQRWELWRRCLAGPLAGALGCLLAAGLTLLLCLLCYWFQTPAACRAADLWAMTGGVS